MSAIKRATTSACAAFRATATQKHFLCGCVDATENLDKEHLIVGCSFRLKLYVDLSDNHCLVSNSASFARSTTS
jgi:hypothetical protein